MLNIASELTQADSVSSMVSSRKTEKCNFHFSGCFEALICKYLLLKPG